MWLVGGGVKPGTIHGATDEYGFYATENKVHVHYLHANLLVNLHNWRSTEPPLRSFPAPGRRTRSRAGGRPAPGW
jgi:hypothetical protein